MDWKGAKKALNEHFGPKKGKKKRSEKEEEQYNLLHNVIEAAQQNKAKQVKNLLDKHPESALHQHVTGWTDGVKTDHLPELRLKSIPALPEQPNSAPGKPGSGKRTTPAARAARGAQACRREPRRGGG